MRLLFVSHSLPPLDRPLDNLGGMQRVAIDLHDSLLAQPNAEVRTLVLQSPWNQRHFRVPLFLGQTIHRIRRMASRGEIDAVLFSSMVTGALAVPLRRHLRKHGVVTAAIANGLDATIPTWPYPRFIRKVFDSLDLVLPISNATADACRNRGLSEDKSEVVLLGIALDRFEAPLDRGAARQELLSRWDVTDTPALILCSVGRLVPRKGVAWFVENVMPALPPDVRYLVAGEGPDRPRIESAIRAEALDHRVKLLGAVSEADLRTLYRGSDLFIMPNVPVAGDMEGFGLVMLEAGLSGLPTIASRLEGLGDVISEGQNGHLVATGVASEYRDAILNYHGNPRLLAQTSANAREYTETRFGWERVTDRYVEVLHRLIQEHGRMRASKYGN